MIKIKNAFRQNDFSWSVESWTSRMASVQGEIFNIYETCSNLQSNWHIFFETHLKLWISFSNNFFYQFCQPAFHVRQLFSRDDVDDEVTVKERLAGPGPARLVGVALERRSSSGKDRVRVSLDRRLRLLHGLLQEIHFRENCCLITNKLTFKFYL